MKKTLMYQSGYSTPYISSANTCPSDFAITFKIKFTEIPETLKANVFGIGFADSSFSKNATYIYNGFCIKTENTFDFVYNKGSKISIPKSVLTLDTWFDVIMYVKNKKSRSIVASHIIAQGGRGGGKYFMERHT